jgi:hypothetical protein
MSQTIDELKSALPPRCRDCAFTPGTDANASEITQQKAHLCLEANTPFYCHLDEQGELLAEHEYRTICRGWLNAALERHEVPAWKRAVAASLLEVISDVEDAHKRGEQIPDEQFDEAILHATEQALTEFE